MSKLINNNTRFIYSSSNSLVNLYSFMELYQKGTRPVIYIRGCNGRLTINTKKILDNAPNNFNLVKFYDGFWYNSDVHIPYIVDFNLKDCIKNGKIKKEDINLNLFANSIINTLEKANLKNVDIIGTSNGGTIALLCSKSDRVERVSTISPTVPFDYLASLNRLNKEKFNSILDLAFYLASFLYWDKKYGFIKDFETTYTDPNFLKQNIDSNKCFILAGNINRTISKNIFDIAKELSYLMFSKMIEKETGFKSDGRVITDEDYYKNIAVKYEIASDDFHMYCNREYLLKRAYNNLEKIKH